MESKWFVRSCSSISRLERWRVRHALESLHRSLTLLKELSVACPQINRSAKNALTVKHSSIIIDSGSYEMHPPYATSRCSSVVEQRFCKPPMLGELSRNTTGVV